MRHSFFKIIIPSSLIFLASCVPENSIQVGQIENIKFTGIENNAILCQAELQIENNYFLPFKLDADEINVYASDKILGSIQLKNTLHIKAKEKKVYEIEFKFIPAVGNGGILSIIQMFNIENINITLKGNIRAHSFLVNKSIPFEIPINSL
jgi:hypothetical protein